jgi:hypothetical protein
MTMRFMDGFDVNKTSAGLLEKWSTITASPSFPAGVYGKGFGLQNPNLTQKVLGINITTGMQGFHFFYPTGAGAVSIVAFQDSGTTQTDLRVNAGGQLFFTRNGTTIGTTSTLTIAPNQWYWIECQVTISTTVGVANVYVNATSYLAQSSLNTQNTGNSTFNEIALIGANSNIIMDSYHCWDTAAGDITTFPYGEHIIDTELANAVGTNTTWNRGGTNTGNNFSQVNEVNNDGDTTYVWMVASGANDIDSYGFVTLQETSGIIGVLAINTISRIDDVGPHVYDHYVLSSGSSALSSGISPGANYLNAQSFQGTDPNTSSAWTIAGRNAAEFGYKFIS